MLVYKYFYFCQHIKTFGATVKRENWLFEVVKQSGRAFYEMTLVWFSVVVSLDRNNNRTYKVFIEYLALHVGAVKVNWWQVHTCTSASAMSFHINHVSKITSFVVSTLPKNPIHFWVRSINVLLCCYCSIWQINKPVCDNFLSLDHILATQEEFCHCLQLEFRAVHHHLWPRDFVYIFVVTQSLALLGSCVLLSIGKVTIKGWRCTEKWHFHSVERKLRKWMTCNECEETRQWHLVAP